MITLLLEIDNNKQSDEYAEKDWTDRTINPSKRKKIDHILSDSAILELMKKIDWEGYKRLFTNIGSMTLATYRIHKLDIFSSLCNVESLEQSIFQIRASSYLCHFNTFYGFQMQYIAFAGWNKLLHISSVFRIKCMNTLASFFVSTTFFKVLWHEKFNHKQHHIYTLNTSREAKFASLYSRKELENSKFISIPKSRYIYFNALINVLRYF